MNSSFAGRIKGRCGVCSGNLSGKAFLTAKCSLHSFHLGCIDAKNHNVCPVCPQPEPPRFSDDDHPPPPPTSSDSLPPLQKVTITSIPERPSVARSASASPFTVLVGLKAPPSLSEESRAPIDLVTVLDVSGSMHGHKLSLLKQAVRFVIDNLGPTDRLSIVSFSDRAHRVLPLRTMNDAGRADAKRAVNALSADGSTNIVDGLRKGVRVLDERRHKNPVANVIFLSDGNDTTHHSRPVAKRFKPDPTSRSSSSPGPGYLHQLPESIYPKENGQSTIPVHTFGFGSDHDPVTMHAIADASGGTFSFIEAHPMIQDAFASCIGGLLSVVTQDVTMTVRSASHGVEVLSVSSGRYRNEITDQGSVGVINVGDLYADEEKDFLVNLSVPVKVDGEGKTSLLDISCTYREVVSNEEVRIEGDNLVEIMRPETVSPADMVVNLEVDRQRNRVYVSESIEEAQKMAESGDLAGARSLLAERREYVRGSVAGKAGDELCTWLENDMKEIEERFGNMSMYARGGRAFALSGMSSHGMQRDAPRGQKVCLVVGGRSGGRGGRGGGGYMTRKMVDMVAKSRAHKHSEDVDMVAKRPRAHKYVAKSRSHKYFEDVDD